MVKFTATTFGFNSFEMDCFEIRSFFAIKVLDKHRKTGKEICRVIVKTRKGEMNDLLKCFELIGKKVKVKGKFIHFITNADSINY